MQTTLRPSLVTAFGAEADRIAKRLPSDTSLLLCDGSSAAEALAEAVRRRREGEAYLVSPMLDDALSVFSQDASRSILAHFPDADQRRQMFEALAFGQLHMNGSIITELPLYQGEVLATMREFSQLGDGTYFRSNTERARIESMLGRRRPYVAVAPLIDDTIPYITPNRDAQHVLVWAPHQSADNLCMYIYALWHLKLPAIFVCRGSIEGTPHRFVLPGQAEHALRESTVIIDTQASDPGTVLAFANRGYGLAAAGSTGAHEYLQGMASYHMHDFSTIYAAATRARADRRAFHFTLDNAHDRIMSIIGAAQPALPENPPLVSIVIPTFNRPREIRANLVACSKQTYPNYEVIVVNDCGIDVSDIVAEFPFARYVSTPKNSGCAVAVNTGLRMARGEFVATVADDDTEYPTFIATLVAALVGSRVDVAHGNIVIRTDTRLPGNILATYGHLVAHDTDHDFMAAFWGGMLLNTSLLVRREAFEKIGFFEDSLDFTGDLDTYIRMTKVYDFAHATSVVGEVSYRDDKSNISSAVGEGLPQSIDYVLRRHAPQDSPMTLQRIEQTVQGVIEGMHRTSYFMPNLRLAEPIPVYPSEHS